MPITSCLWQQSKRHIYPPLGRIRVTDVCVFVWVYACGRFREPVCVRTCERLVFPQTMLPLWFWEKNKKSACLVFLNSGLVVEIGGRCVRAAERGVCHVVIVCGNCLIGLMSASNPLTPTKQSNNYYMTHMSITTHGDTEIYWRVQNKSDHFDF